MLLLTATCCYLPLAAAAAAACCCPQFLSPSSDRLPITHLCRRPALIAGEAFVRYLAADSNDKNASSPFRLDKLFNYALWGALLALVLPNVDVEHGINELIPVLPGEQMQAIGTFFMRAKTCWLPEYLPAAVLPPTVQCREEGDNSIWVLATPGTPSAFFSMCA